MKIIKKIQIKQIVTEESKSEMKEKLLGKIMRLEQECQQLMFEKRKIQNKGQFSKAIIEEKFQREIDSRQEEIKQNEFKLEQLAIIEIGSEIIENEVEALVEVSEGMHWNQIMDKQAIVIKDNVVIRIDK